MPSSRILLLSILLLFSGSVPGTESSEISPNAELELDITCDPASSSSCSSIYSSECNTAGKCQCRWQYWPEASRSGSSRLDFCGIRKCTTTLFCSGLYSVQNSTCHDGQCKCQGGFEYRSSTRQCELMPQYSSWKRLGERCEESNECAGGAMCSRNGYCSCGIGSMPDNDFSCDRPSCDTDEFCRAHVTSGSVCVRDSNSRTFCGCPDDHQGDYDYQACVPRYRKLSQQCQNGLDGYGCGSGAVCSPVNGCQCLAGFRRKSERDCEQIKCLTNTECLQEDINSMCVAGSCRCRDGYSVDELTQQCKLQVVRNVVLIVASISWAFVLCAVCCVVFYCWRKRKQSKSVPEKLQKPSLSPPPYSETLSAPN